MSLLHLFQFRFITMFALLKQSVILSSYWLSSAFLVTNFMWLLPFYFFHVLLSLYKHFWFEIQHQFETFSVHRIATIHKKSFYVFQPYLSSSISLIWTVKLSGTSLFNLFSSSEQRLQSIRRIRSPVAWLC